MQDNILQDNDSEQPVKCTTTYHYDNIIMSQIYSFWNNELK